MKTQTISEIDGDFAQALTKPIHTAQTSIKWAQRCGELQGRIETLEGERDFVTAQRDELLEALKDAIGWLNHSDVRYLISTKLGEQASLHATLNKSRTAISKAEQH